MSERMVLHALDGSNPLAFLAALGTLRLLDLHDPTAEVQINWRRDPAWRPELSGLFASKEQLCETLLAAKTVPLESFAALGKDITVSRDTFRGFVEHAFEDARQGNKRTQADFAAAFGSEVCEEKDKDRIEYTDLCFITGSGHQHFLGTMSSLGENVTVDHLFDALFGNWKRDKGLSMRWDPGDAAEYALRWGDPSKDGASAVWGANWLAIEALPLVPVQPSRRGLETTAFRNGERGEWPQFTWPIWTQPATQDTVRSLLSLTELQEPDRTLEREKLRARGIDEVYRAERVRIGQGANFKVSFRPSRAI